MKTKEYNNVEFQGFTCKVQIEEYQNNGRKAITLIDVEDYSPVATATINMPDVHLGPNEVIVKNYSENDGMLQALVDAGIVKHTGKLASAYLSTPICTIL